MWKLTKHIAFRAGWFNSLVLYVEERRPNTKEKRWRRATWADQRVLRRDLVQIVNKELKL